MATTSQARQALIDNPPPKCPYFTLPDVCHFSKETRASKARKKTGYVSIVALWGSSNKMTEETTTDFLLQLLKHSDWQPDFEAVAAEWQLEGTTYVKSRLRKIVEDKGYKLVGESKVIDGDGPQATQASKAKKRKITCDTEATKSKPIKKQRQTQKATGSKRGRPASESQHDAADNRFVQGSLDAAGAAEALGMDHVGSVDEEL